MKCLLAAILITQVAHAGDAWTRFRGDGSGVSNGVLFVTSSEGPFQESCQVHAFSLTDGSKQWTQTLAGTFPVENYFRNSRAAPTCVVDANTVYSFFASGDVTALTVYFVQKTVPPASFDRAMNSTKSPSTGFGAATRC